MREGGRERDWCEREGLVREGGIGEREREREGKGDRGRGKSSHSIFFSLEFMMCSWPFLELLNLASVLTN